jgi:hypothetical protein
MRSLIVGAALSLVAGIAFAQQPTAPAAAATNPATVNPPSAAAPPATDTTATASPYRTGGQIKDAQGQLIGTIARIIKTPDGATTVSVNVDGRNVNLPASNLTPSADGGAVSTMSKAQITASTKPPA